MNSIAARPKAVCVELVGSFSSLLLPGQHCRDMDVSPQDDAKTHTVHEQNGIGSSCSVSLKTLDLHAGK